MFTAATWFHRFFMRFSMEDYHRQVLILLLALVRIHMAFNRMLLLRAFFWQPKLKNVAESFVM
jgi:hypothetical protein